MKIYKVYNGIVVSVEVKKETEKYYFVDSIVAFGCISRVNKKFACLTAEEAIKDEIKVLQGSISRFKKTLISAEESLKHALEIAKELKK